MKKVVGSTTTFYFYDTEGKLLEEFNPQTGEGKDYLWMPKSYEPIARVDFAMSETDTGDCLRVSKSSPNVHLDWTLYSGAGNFPIRRGIIGDFANFITLSEQTSKTFNDPVLDNTSSYWYDIKNRSLSDTLYYYHSDHLGTPIAMTDTFGTPVWRAEHLPFGGIYALTISTISNNLRFPGQYYDSETTLSQNWFRDYDAKIGRYREVDPIVLKWDTSFLYGKDNPLQFVDFIGLQAKSVPGACCTHKEWEYKSQPKDPLNPLSQKLAELMNCIQQCYCKERLIVTSTSNYDKTGKRGHSSLMDPHVWDAAFDVRYPQDPKKFLCCAKKCGANFVLDEKEHPSKHSTGWHMHVSTVGCIGVKEGTPNFIPPDQECK